MTAMERTDAVPRTVVPLDVGESVYAVPRDRIATVLRLGALEGVEPGDEIDLGDHTVEVFGAAAALCEPRGPESTVVVFHGPDDSDRIPGWLVDDVAAPERVEDVEIAVGSVGHVRGRIRLDGEFVVLLDPTAIHAR